MELLSRFFNPPRQSFYLFGPRGTGKSAWAGMHYRDAACIDLQTALAQGIFPVVWDADSPMDVLSSYVGVYLREEVQAEGLVRKLGGFSRFLEAISFSHGQVLNLSNVARECEVKRKTVEGFLSVLEDLLLCYLLPVFQKRAKRATVKHPKFYIFDTGVFQRLRPSGPLDRIEEKAGPALEGLVGQHIRAWNAYSGANNELYYWRTQGGSEIDFVVYGPDVFYGIEVKHATRVNRNDLRGLKAFADDYPEAELILLHRGDETLQMEGIQCVPCQTFLEQLIPGKPLLSEE